MPYEVRALLETDWPRVREIYAQGIASGNSTFEEILPSWETWSATLRPDARLVALFQGEVVGWAVLKIYSTRAVFSGVAWTSLYLDTAHQGKGLGKLLLKELIDLSEKRGVWTLKAGIFPENTASIRLHESLGFRHLGTSEKIGWHRGMWRSDAEYERRSTVVGLQKPHI